MNLSHVHDIKGLMKSLKQLKLMEKALESISDGELVNSLIHGYISFSCFIFSSFSCGFIVLNSTRH